MESMNSSFAKVLFFIISASVAINIPRFFETSIVTMGHPNNTSVFPDLEGFSYTFEVSPLRTDPDYIRYFLIFSYLIKPKLCRFQNRLELEV